MLEAVKNGVIRGAAPNFFWRPCRVQKPTPHYTPTFPKARRLTDPKHTGTLPCALTLLEAKESGTCPTSSSALLHAHEEQPYRREVQAQYFKQISLHCQHIILLLHLCRTRRTLRNRQMNHSSPQHLRSFLHHFQVTHWKQRDNKSEREKKIN